MMDVQLFKVYFKCSVLCQRFQGIIDKNRASIYIVHRVEPFICIEMRQSQIAKSAVSILLALAVSHGGLKRLYRRKTY